MADTHIEVDEAKYHARKIMDSVREVGTRFKALQLVFGALGRMKDGDGSQAAHFAKVVTLLGVQGVDDAAKLAKAKALYDEMNSMLNNSAALLQFLDIVG